MKDYYDEKVYVYNRGSGTISVLSAENDTKMGQDIEVGEGVRDIIVKPEDTAVYVSNDDTGGVLIIDGAVDKVVARIAFAVNPSNGGQITCNKNMTPPLNQYIYVNSSEKCKAEPNKGYEFSSWVEDLGGNSTQIINQSGSISPLDSISDSLGFGTEKPEAELTVTKFGTFTANFRELPPPIPPQYWATLFAVVASAFVGSWLTPSFIGWRKAKKQGNRLDHYHKKIEDLYKDGLDMNDIRGLDELSDSIKDEYTRGKITKEQFDRLIEDISIRYQEIFKKEIDSLKTDLYQDDKEKWSNEIKDNIEDAYVKGKISEQHYNLLNKKIESIVNTDENKKCKLVDTDET
jgi:uncharacterized membrane protein